MACSPSSGVALGEVLVGPLLLIEVDVSSLLEWVFDISSSPQEDSPKSKAQPNANKVFLLRSIN